MDLRKFSDINKNKDIKELPNEDFEKDIENIIKELKQIKPIKQNNLHKGHRARLKSQFLENGISSLTDIQKIELILFFAIPQKDTNPLAHNLLDHFGSFKEVMQASYDELMRVSGIKENSALLIRLINSLSNYYHKPTNEEELNTTGACLEYAKNLFYGVNVEQFYVVCLNKSGTVKKCVLINSGSGDEVKVEIRKITQVALENNSNRILLCHNHPYGIAKFSDEDVKLTYSIICSCILNSIDVVDHILVATNGNLSMHEIEVMEKVKAKAIDKVQISKETELFLSASSKQYIRSKIVKMDL